MSERLYLFTAEYPFGKGETFIENEIPVLVSEFDEVILVPHSQTGVQRPIPDGARIAQFDSGYKSFNTSATFKQYRWSIVRVLIKEWSQTKKKAFFLKRLRHFAVLLSKAFFNSDKIKQLIDSNPGKNYYYSFWNSDWALALAVLKKRGHIQNFVTRSGGFDIYDERHPGNYLPFRRFVYKHCSRIMPNSQMGERYIRALNIYPHKVHHSYWGTTDKGLNPYEPSDKVRIVSISNIIPLKRLHLTVEVLSKLNMPFEWVHFGDGELMDDIRKQSALLEEKGNVVDFRGRVSNEVVLDFFRNQSVDVFITTSYTEGLPVSIQEALSFGIPVFATNVGGMAEIVTPQTGTLIERDFDLEEAGQKLTRLIQNEVRDNTFRKGVRTFWEKQFNANVTYRTFSNIVKDLPG